MDLNLLRGDLSVLSLDKLVALSAEARALQSEYHVYELEVPAVLEQGLQSLDTIIRMKRRDQLAKRLAEIRAREAALKTTAEKRAELQKEARKIEALLK